MSTPAPQSATSTPLPIALIQARYVAALTRASALKLVAYRNSDGSYSVPSHSVQGLEHTVRFCGTQWWNLSCTCAGSRAIACTHRSVVVFARHHHVYAKRPAAPCRDCGAPAVTGFSRCASCARRCNDRLDASDAGWHRPLAVVR